MCVDQVVSESKRPRLDPATSSPSTPASRRSQRTRRGRGEKEIFVSSDQTLLELKREVKMHIDSWS